MVGRAQRRAVPLIIGAAVRAKPDVVAVQVPVGRAAGHCATPAVALEHAVIGWDLEVRRAPGSEAVLEHRVESLALARGAAMLLLDPSLDGCQNGPEFC